MRGDEPAIASASDTVVRVAAAGGRGVRRSRGEDRRVHGRLLVEAFGKHAWWQRLGVWLQLLLSVSYTNSVGFLSVRRVWRPRTLAAAYVPLFVAGCVDWSLYSGVTGPVGLVTATALLAGTLVGLACAALRAATVLDYPRRWGWDSVSNVVAVPRERRPVAAGMGARPVMLALDDGALRGRVTPRDRDLALRATPGTWTTREDLHRFYTDLGWQLVPGQDPDARRPLYVLPVRPTPAAG